MSKASLDVKDISPCTFHNPLLPSCRKTKQESRIPLFPGLGERERCEKVLMINGCTQKGSKLALEKESWPVTERCPVAGMTRGL